MKKEAHFFLNHKYAMIFFLYPVLYNFLIVNNCSLWSVSEITYAYHVVDYSFGIRSNILPGAIFYGIFGEHASQKNATAYETLLMLAFFFGMAILLEKVLLNFEKQYRIKGFLLILFFLSGAFTFASFTDELGMLDAYWLYFSLVFFYILENKFLRWLIPVLFVLSLAVHFSSVLNYLILFSIVLLYRISDESEKMIRYIYSIIFVLSMVITVLVFIYFLLVQSKEAVITYEQFHETMESRGNHYFVYYDYEFFNRYGDTDVVPVAVFSIKSPVLKLVKMIIAKSVFTFKSYASETEKSVLRLALTFFILSPITAFFYKHLFAFFKECQSNKLKHFCLFLIMVQFPFTSVLGCMFSPDIVRWFTHAFLIQFVLFLYLLHREVAFRDSVVEDIERFKGCLPVYIYALVYGSLYMWPYC